MLLPYQATIISVITTTTIMKLVMIKCRFLVVVVGPLIAFRPI